MIWLLTVQDPNPASHTLGTLLVTSMFRNFEIGRAAAIAVILFVLVFAASAAVLRLLKTRVGPVMNPDDGEDENRHRQNISRALIFAALCGYALWVVFPMIWMAYSSLKSRSRRHLHPHLTPCPSPGSLPHFENYRRCLARGAFRGLFFPFGPGHRAISVAA